MNASQTPSTSQRAADVGQDRETIAPEKTAGAQLAEQSGNAETITNGPAAAAILAAGIGCFAIGLFALAGDASPAVASFFTFYKPTGALSGVTTSAIVVWLLSWFALSRQWGTKSVALGWVILVSSVLLALSLMLTFPPFMDLLQGK
jgi:hypothetical protein